MLELLAVGVSASIGQYFLTKAFTAGDPSRVSVVSLSQFVMILILDVVVLEHPLNWHKLWGIPLILGPTVWLMMQRVKTSTIVLSAQADAKLHGEETRFAIHADSAASAETK